jgi:hypothetical protein
MAHCSSALLGLSPYDPHFPEPPKDPATGTKGDGVAGFFLGDMAMSIMKELGFSLAIAVAVVAGLRFVFLMCEWAFA